jgi:hypothetical protein
MDHKIPPSAGQPSDWMGILAVQENDCDVVHGEPEKA